MIRINLLAAERERTKQKIAFPTGQKLTAVCSLMIVLAGGLIGWRYWSLGRESSQLDTDISAAGQETARLKTIIQQVQQFESQKSQLQERVALIEQLRKTQAGPVHMLDQISRAVPSMLWLTELKQNNADVVIDGRCTSLMGLSDFITNLEGSGFFKKSVEILSSQAESVGQPPSDLIKFSIKAQFQPPSEAKATAGTPAPAAAPPAKPGP